MKISKIVILIFIIGLFSCETPVIEKVKQNKKLTTVEIQGKFEKDTTCYKMIILKEENKVLIGDYNTNLVLYELKTSKKDYTGNIIMVIVFILCIIIFALIISL